MSSNINPYSVAMAASNDTYTINNSNTIIGNPIDNIYDALLLLKRDVDMEAKYPKLRELKKAYEAQLEKYKIWEELK